MAVESKYKVLPTSAADLRASSILVFDVLAEDQNLQFHVSPM